MTREIDFEVTRGYGIPLTTRFRRTVREGMLIEGLAWWGEFSPFADYGDHESASWSPTTIEQCTVAGCRRVPPSRRRSAAGGRRGRGRCRGDQVHAIGRCLALVAGGRGRPAWASSGGIRP